MGKYSYVVAINQANQKYNRYVEQYISSHITKIDFLVSPARLKYPLTIVYPLGDKIYIISVRTPLLITRVDRAEFQDSVQVVDTLIANNSRLLNDKNIQPKEWWKSRDRVDRSIGNTVNQINLCIWDLELPEPALGMNLTDKQSKMFKFVYAALRNSITDQLKIKAMLEDNSLCASKAMYDDIFIKANSIYGSS